MAGYLFILAIKILLLQLRHSAQQSTQGNTQITPWQLAKSNPHLQILKESEVIVGKFFDIGTIRLISPISGFVDPPYHTS